jgi:hypothetical protein
MAKWEDALTDAEKQELADMRALHAKSGDVLRRLVKRLKTRAEQRLRRETK